MKRENKSSTKKQKQYTAKKPSAADFLSSPPLPPPSTAAIRRKSVPEKPNEPPKTVSSLAELKELASSRLESIRRNTETTHSDILNQLDYSNSFLHKRLKNRKYFLTLLSAVNQSLKQNTVDCSQVQTQACQKLMDETDKELKKMLERIGDSSEAMKASYSEFHVEGETTSSRVRKTTIPEKVQFFETAIDALRNRYATPSSA